MSVCKKCGGSGIIKNDFKKNDYPVQSACPDCNGTGVEAETKVELTATEKLALEYHTKSGSDAQTRELVKMILEKRLTALQSAHDKEIKELKKKVMAAIPSIGYLMEQIERYENYDSDGIAEAIIASITQSLTAEVGK